MSNNLRRLDDPETSPGWRSTYEPSHQTNLTRGIRFYTATAIVFMLMCLMSSLCAAETFEFRFDELQPTSYLDRWMYPFNISPGSRIQAPTFGAISSEAFDERDGQLIVAVNTSDNGVLEDSVSASRITDGLPADRYRINSATLTLTETSGGYIFDATYDRFFSYLPPTSQLFREDEDDGRPIELYGVGFRNGFDRFAWPDGVSHDSPEFGSATEFGPAGKENRNVFAADAMGRDVSNNVDSIASGVNGFDPTPFAVARIFKNDVELQPGEVVPAASQLVFEIDVDDPSIHAYLASSLSAGQLGFTVTSLHATGVQGAGDPFPNLATANHFAFDGPVLTLDVVILDGIDGDFDGDFLRSATDIDLLSAAIRINSSNTDFDLNQDGSVDDLDRSVWMNLAGTVSGDVNLDGQVDFGDFLVLSQNFGLDGGWTAGDVDGSGDVRFQDFLLLSENFGKTTMAYSSVPEPNASAAFVVGMVMLARFRRRANSNP